MTKYTSSIFLISSIISSDGSASRAKYIEKSLNEQYSKDNEPKYKESNEEIAVYEMNQRINALRQSGLPESPD